MKVSNKQIAQAFRNAARRLDTGRARRGSDFICCAIGLGNRRADAGYISLTGGADGAGQAAIAVVLSRLDGCNTFNSWLTKHGVSQFERTDELMQKHRHAWLDMLIKEFEAK